MRKVLAFGADGGFAGEYSSFFQRNGFELDIFNAKKNQAQTADGSVLLVFGNGLGQKDADAVYALSMKDRRLLPLVFISGPDGEKSTGIRKIRSLARYTLQQGFLKKDLLSALKGSSELLYHREKSALLKEELESKTSELTYVLDIARSLASSFELNKVLTKIMERACFLVKAESWAVMLVDEESNELVFELARGKAAQKPARYRVLPDDGIAGWAAAEKEPKLVPDVKVEKRFTRSLDKATGVKSRSVMAVPILSKGKLLGVMQLINKAGQGGFSPDDLSHVSRLMDQTAIAIDRSRLYQRMEGLVITDDLTKLFNLRYLHRTLEVEIERASRYGISVSLIFMDMDYFKQVNDQYGHVIGSKLLVEVSQQLLKGLRKVDIVARYGGDEFVIVLPQTHIKAATMIAERLRRSIDKHVFLKSENLSLRLTASFGIASYPDHAATKDDLIRLADEAMYRVKNQTRNSVYVVGT